MRSTFVNLLILHAYSIPVSESRAKDKVVNARLKTCFVLFGKINMFCLSTNNNPESWCRCTLT